MPEISRSSRIWAALVTGSVMLLVSAWVPLLDLEYWWSIALGRVVETYRVIPTHNFFTYTSPPNSVVFIGSWLSDWWMYRIHNVVGLAGALTLRNLSWAALAILVSSKVTKRSG